MSSDLSVAVIGAIAAIVASVTAGVGAWLGARSSGKHAVKAATLPARQSAYKAALDLLLPEIEALRRQCTTVNGSGEVNELDCDRTHAQLDALMLCTPDELVPALAKVREAVERLSEAADQWVDATTCLERVGDEAIRLGAQEAVFAFEEACRSLMMSVFLRQENGSTQTVDSRELRAALANTSLDRDAGERLVNDVSWLTEHYAAKYAAVRDAADMLVSLRKCLVEESRAWLHSH